MGLRFGLHPVVRIRADIGGDEFFRQPPKLASLKPSSAWNDEVLYFGWHRVPLQGNSPAWHANPFNEKTVDAQIVPWWKLPDFTFEAGDIKTVWEASRFDWVPALAQRAKTGCAPSLKRLNFWLSDWCRANPSYYGPNWKCGQEASIRVMHLAMAARILDQPDMCPDLARLVEAHLLRIYLTVSYSLAQDNNHGTSEAAALFIGGSWCEANGIDGGRRWAQKGRRLMENRVKRLIAPDGSFSQYSLNYHRVLVDTLSMVEVWRKWRGLDEFSPLFYRRARTAANWLYAMVDPESGDAPNLGGNDGAWLIHFTDTGYRDFRPSVQLAMALFLGRGAYEGEGEFDEQLKWMGVSPPDERAKGSEPQQFDYGGYSVLRHGRWMAVLKYPRYRFRPRHCDALHVDLWIGSDNLLRDGGSYSYNAGEYWENYFTGSESHNTIEFDGRDQMPRLGRFLRGAWLEGRDVEFGKESDGWIYASSGYRDWKGAFHHRKIRLREGALVVHDRVKGFSERAVLRWRLQSGNWKVKEGTAVCNGYKLRIKSDVSVVRFELVQGWESRFYYHKEALPVLEVEIQDPGEIVSEFLAEP